VLSQRLRIVQAARLREGLVREYLHAVAEAALDGQLDGAAIHTGDPRASVEKLLQIKGIGPFAADLVVLRGGTVPDAIPTKERRLEDEIADLYGSDRSLADVSEAWRPFRTWASVHLRALREQRTHEINPGPPGQ
jgi:DNA-3-methyladenine glycosylase II